LSFLVFVYDALRKSDHMAATIARLVSDSKKVLEGTDSDTIEVTSCHLSQSRGSQIFCWSTTQWKL